MLQIEMERGLSEQRLTISKEPEDCDKTERSDFREQMLMNNDIEGILKFTVRRTDDRKYYDYEISGKDTLEAFLSRKRVGRECVADILRGILGTVYRAREYMLKESDFVIAPDTVFVDQEGRISLIYRSGYGIPLKDQLTGIAEYLMNKVDNSDDPAVLLIYAIYMKTKDSACAIEDLFSLISNKKTCSLEEESLDSRIRTAVPASSPAPSFAADRRVSWLREEISLFITSSASMKIKALLGIAAGVVTAVIVYITGRLRGTAALFGTPAKGILAAAVGAGITVMLEALVWLPYRARIMARISRNASEREAVTELMETGRKKEPELILVSDEYEPISADRYPFYVGKDPNRVDHVLDYAGVSRCHLKIDHDAEANQFLLIDLNSTNGTFINGERLEPHVAYSVVRGDEILIGPCIYYCN